MIGATGVAGSLVSVLAGSSTAINTQLNAAMEQESTGRVADDFAGLGASAQVSLNLNPQIAHLKTWQTNIDAATGRLNVAQSALTQISSVCSKFYAQAETVNGSGGSDVASIAADAKVALAQVAQLFNTKDGDVYVFAGQDTANAPLPSTDPAVLGTGLLAVPQGTAPFSATLGTAVPSVEVGDGQRVQVGLLANSNTLATSTGTQTTGSYARDILQGLARLAALTDGPTAQATAAQVSTQLHDALAAISTEQGALGDIQSGLTTRQTGLVALQNAVTNQVSDVQDVDLAATLTKVQSLQTQLQASYQLIAGVRSLTLSNYLGG